MQRKKNIKDVPTITSRGGKINILVSPGTVGSAHVVMGYSELAVNERVNPHVHDYSEESFYVLEGEGRIHIEDIGVVEFAKGDAVLVPLGKTHWIENIGQQPMKVVFSVSPLAPTPAAGHRDVIINSQEYA